MLLIVLAVILAVLWRRHAKNRRLYQQRSENILFVAQLLDNYRKHINQLERSRGLTFDMNTMGDYALLTEPECMEDIRSFLSDPYSEEQNTAFRRKMEEMDRRAAELQTLFSPKLAAPMVRFLKAYSATLDSLLHYQLFILRKNQDFTRFCTAPMPQEEQILYFRDGEPRMELLRRQLDLKEAVYLLLSKSTLYMVQRKFRLPKD